MAMLTDSRTNSNANGYTNAVANDGRTDGNTNGSTNGTSKGNGKTTGKRMPSWYVHTGGNSNGSNGGNSGGQWNGKGNGKGKSGKRQQSRTPVTQPQWLCPTCNLWYPVAYTACLKCGLTQHTAMCTRTDVQPHTEPPTDAVPWRRNRQASRQPTHHTRSKSRTRASSKPRPRSRSKDGYRPRSASRTEGNSRPRSLSRTRFADDAVTDPYMEYYGYAPTDSHESDDMKAVRAEHDAIKAQYLALQGFDTESSNTTREGLKNRMTTLQHRITLMKPIGEQIAVFERMLAARNTRAEQLHAKLVKAERAVELADKAAKLAKDNCDAFNAQVLEAQNLLAAAKDRQAQHQDDHLAEAEQINAAADGSTDLAQMLASMQGTLDKAQRQAIQAILDQAQTPASPICSTPRATAESPSPRPTAQAAPTAKLPTLPTIAATPQTIHVEEDIVQSIGDSPTAGTPHADRQLARQRARERRAAAVTTMDTNDGHETRRKHDDDHNADSKKQRVDLTLVRHIIHQHLNTLIAAYPNTYRQVAHELTKLPIDQLQGLSAAEGRLAKVTAPIAEGIHTADSEQADQQVLFQFDGELANRPQQSE